jgi:beta-carotene 3-hydroxylase
VLKAQLRANADPQRRAVRPDKAGNLVSADAKK